MWRSFFEGIEYLFVEILMKPMDWLAQLELANWWVANIITFIFIITTCVAFVYWMRQLNIFHKDNGDAQDTTAHSFLE